MEAHNELMFGNPDNAHLQRRKLNIEESQCREFHSDEEEAVIQLDGKFSNIEKQPIHMQEEELKLQADKIQPGVQKLRNVPKSRQFLDLNGKPQRNLPIYELDELWEIPNEYDDAEPPQKIILEGEFEIPAPKIF